MSEIDAQEHFFNRLPVPAFTVNAALRVVWWSDAMEALTGCARGSIQGRPAWGAFSAERIATPVERACILGEDHEEFLTFKHQGSGERATTRWRVRPHLDVEGCVQGASVVVEPEAPQGATVEMKATMSLEDELLARCSPNPVMVCDKNLTITYANKAALSLLRKVEEHLPVPVDRLVGQSIDIFHKNPMHQRRLLGDPSRLPIKTRIKLGPEIMDLHIYGLFSPMGEYIGPALTWEVVTEQVRHDEEQTAEIHRVKAIVEDSPAPMMICDIHDEFRIKHMNNATSQLLQQVQGSLPVRADKIMGQSIDIFHKNPLRIRNLLMDPSNLPVRSRNKLGEEHFDVHVYPLYDHNGVYTSAALIWDCVTEQVQMHERQATALKAAEQIQRALQRLAMGDIDARVDEVFSGEMEQMRHDFNEIAGVLRDFRDEFARLAEANQRGQTAVRANASKFSGDLAGIMLQVNHMLDGVQRPVEALQRHLGMMAAGDLRVVISESYQGDHAVLKDAYNRSLGSLNDILNSVKGGARQIGRSASEIAAASQQVSEGASAQAAAIEEISAQMAEMTSKTDENARNAAQANQLVASARTFASEGDKQMTSMIASMNEINEASQSISSIIKVIDEIAFQTNLLALNAAVEAARAGVHGKGFAVVAEEVRNLAARSAQAARETTELIKGSAKTVNQGMVIASQTAEALSSIVSGVTQVSELVARIASASREQAQGIGQVNLGLEQINEVTLANTAGAEQSATATRQLRQLVEELQGMLSRFQLLEPAAPSTQGLPSWVTPEMLRALQSMAPGGAPAPHQHQPSAAQRPGSFIHLGEQDFGKY
jgi:methyl-accepting chemotaxis protein